MHGSPNWPRQADELDHPRKGIVPLTGGRSKGSLLRQLQAAAFSRAAAASAGKRAGWPADQVRLNVEGVVDGCVGGEELRG